MHNFQKFIACFLLQKCKLIMTQLNYDTNSN